MTINRIGPLIAAACSLLPAAYGSASARDLTGSDFPNWDNGQLIFIEGDTPLEKAITAATHSPYARVGIVRMTGGGPVVLDTREYLWELYVEDFIDESASGRYAVYGVRGLTDGRAFTPPRIANDYLKTPDDPFLLPGTSEMYGAELVNLTYRSVGVELGRFIPLGSLDVDNAAVRDWFSDVWRGHPDCSARGLGMEECWKLVAQQNVITPASIADDPHLVCLWSNFAADRDRCPGPQ